jgi:phosphoglycerate-specific signal transduction histidine kinase
MGFKVIKSLLAQLNGRIAVASNTPKGVIVQLDVPLEANEAYRQISIIRLANCKGASF